MMLNLLKKKIKSLQKCACYLKYSTFTQHDIHYIQLVHKNAEQTVGTMHIKDRSSDKFTVSDATSI